MADFVFIYGVASLVMSILTIIGNALIIVAFNGDPKLQSRPSNMLILAIAVSDFIYGIYLFVYYGITFGKTYGEIGCMISVITDYTYIVSNVLLVTISLDRLLLVMVPYSKYTAWQSKLRIKMQIGFCYGLGIISAIVELSIWNYAKRVNAIAASIDFNLWCTFPPRKLTSYGLLVSLGYFCIPVVLVTVLSSIFFTLLKLRIKKKTKTNQVSCSTISGTQSQVTSTTQGDEEVGGENHGGDRKKLMKPAITLASLVTSMGLTSLPFCIYTIIVIARPDLNSFEVIYIMWLIAQMNPLLDPLFYGATQRSIQEYYKKVFVRLFKRS